MKPSILDAVLNLVPGASVSFDGSLIIWHDYTDPPVTTEQIQLEYEKLLREYDNNEYRRLRAAEYPPATDYLDGVVKGDQAQIDKYISDCLAVKAKYPKPDVL